MSDRYHVLLHFRSVTWHKKWKYPIPYIQVCRIERGNPSRSICFSIDAQKKTVKVKEEWVKEE
jgi:hypothetical protein